MKLRFKILSRECVYLVYRIKGRKKYSPVHFDKKLKTYFDAYSKLS